MSDGKRHEQYRSPELVRVGDARELTLGRDDWVADVPGMPDMGWFDASKPGSHKEPYNPPTEPKPPEPESEEESGLEPEQTGS